MDALTVTARWVIPADALSVRAVTSSGPGGQNVNKVATKVELRLELACERLSDGQRARLAESFPSKITKDGQLVLTCDEHRSQMMNLEGARKRLSEMLLSVQHPPKVRRATRPTLGSKKRRLADKQHRGAIKKGRQGNFD